MTALPMDLLSDPSPIIGTACHPVPNSLTHSCLVNLIDEIQACEDAYSKLVEVVTVADVIDKNRVGVEILKLMLNQVLVI